MPKKLKFGQGPLHLPAYEKKSGCLQVIIETCKGSRKKYAFEPDQSIFALKKVLPAGMAFSYDCLLKCRMIGIIEGEQGKKKDRERNDGYRYRRDCRS